MTLQLPHTRQASVADIVGRLQPSLPRFLPEGSVAAVADAASGLPASWCDALGFEIALGADVCAVDLAVQVSSVPARHHLTDWARRKAGAEGAWKGLAAFGTAWADPFHPTAAVVDSLWIEVDASRPDRGVLPSVFLSAARDVPLPDGLHRLLTYVEEISGEPIDEATRRLAEVCVAEAPSNRHHLQVGVMLSRRPAPLRLCIGDLQPDSAVHLLEASGVAPEHQQVLQQAVAHLPIAVDVTAAFDLAAGRLARIGLECGVPANRQRLGQAEPRWARLLDHGVAAGLITRRQATGLTSWSGTDLMRLPQYAWDVQVYRGISHLKFLATRDHLRVKAYVGYLPDRVTLALGPS